MNGEGGEGDKKAFSGSKRKKRGVGEGGRGETGGFRLVSADRGEKGGEEEQSRVCFRG